MGYPASPIVEEVFQAHLHWNRPDHLAEARLCKNSPSDFKHQRSELFADETHPALAQ